MSRSHEGAGNFPTVWPEESQKYDERELEILQAERSGAQYVPAAEERGTDDSQSSDNTNALDAQRYPRYGGGYMSSEAVIID